MPNIKEFDTPNLGLQPSDRGAAAFAAVGRRAGAFYREAGQSLATTGARLGSALASAGDAAVSYLDHREISAGTATSAQLLDNATQGWNDTAKNADPNDPSVRKKWLEEELEPKLQQFQDGFTTEKSQAWALHRVDQIREHLFTKTAADMTTLAGVAVTNNIRNTANIYSNTAMNDPSSVPSMIDHVDHDVEGIIASSPNLKGSDAARVREEVSQKTKEAIVKAGAFGAIQKSDDPVATADEWGRKYPQYINGVELKTLGKAAEAQKKSNLLTEKQLAQFNKQDQKDKADTKLSKTWTDNVSFDPNGKSTVQPGFFQKVMDVERQHPGAATDRARTFINWGQQQQREHNEIINTKPEVYSNLITGLFKTDNPTTDVDILKAAANHDLSPHDTTIALQMYKALEDAPMKGPIWHDTMDAVKNELVVSVPGLPGKDTVGLMNYAKFAQTFIPQYTAMKRAGTLPDNALDLKDPNSLISKSMSQFKRDMTQRLQDYTAILGGGSERKVGNVSVPRLLQGIAALQYNPKTGQWRDQASGIVYDSAGNEIKK